MPACADPPNRPPREVLDRLVDQVAWAVTCMMIAGATSPGTSEREVELSKLRIAVLAPRAAVDAILGQNKVLPSDLLVNLRTCELAIPKLEAGAVLRRSETP